MANETYIITAGDKSLVPVTGIGLACWASYLVNGDDSGISEEDKEAADRFVEVIGSNIVSCGEESFFGTCDVFGVLPGDCLEYTALVEE